MVVLLNFCFLEISQIFLRYALLFTKGGIDWIFYGLICCFVNSQFISLRYLWNNRINSLNKLPLIWTKELIILVLMIWFRLMAVIILLWICKLLSLLLVRIWQLVVPSRATLSLWWPNRFSFSVILCLLIPIAWPLSIWKVETGSCLEVLSRLDVVVLLTLNAGSHSTYLNHLLFILVENMHLIFIILFHKEHFLVCLIICCWWHCLMRTGLTILLDKHGRVDVVNRTHFILAYVFSLVTIFVEVQISEILSRVAAWLNLIRTLRCRHLEIVTISKILTVAHI